MRCAKIKIDGKRCKAHAIEGSLYCHFHSDPQAAADAGRKSKPPAAASEHIYLGRVPRTPEQILDVLQQALYLSARGTLKKKQADTIARLAQITLKYTERVELAKRLEALEARVGASPSA